MECIIWSSILDFFTIQRSSYAAEMWSRLKSFPYIYLLENLICIKHSTKLQRERETDRQTERMKTFGLKASLLLMTILFFTDFLNVEGQVCHPSGKIRGKKPPPGECNQGNDSDCCKEGKLYTTYKCSPTVSSHTKAYLTLNGFEKDEDGGAPSECDNQYHSDDTPVVALSTGWYNKGSRCLNNITITANGRSVVAMVVDECDSTMGCDSDHDYQPPCANNIVDASRAVWKALGVPRDQWGGLDITWTNA